MKLSDSQARPSKPEKELPPMEGRACESVDKIKS